MGDPDFEKEKKNEEKLRFGFNPTIHNKLRNRVRGQWETVGVTLKAGDS